jgi:hypothetical protein
MRALVALTVFMGVLLVAGCAVVAVTILHRISARPTPSMVAGAPGRASVPLPPGARVAGMTAVGERLVLQVAAPDRSDMLILLDPASGAVLETIDLVPQPPAVSP